MNKGWGRREKCFIFFVCCVRCMVGEVIERLFLSCMCLFSVYFSDSKIKFI